MAKYITTHQAMTNLQNNATDKLQNKYVCIQYTVQHKYIIFTCNAIQRTVQLHTIQGYIQHPIQTHITALCNAK